jgi:tripeptide aminopeptidase
MDPNVRTLIELIRIPGETGREEAISAEVAGRLREMGVPPEDIASDGAHRRSEYGGEVGNLVVRFPGRRAGEHRMLSTHLDTVPGAVGSEPRLEGDRIVNAAPGRALGGDARCGVACLLAAARALAERKGDHPPRTLCFFVQEEVGLVGSGHLDVSLLGDPPPEVCFNFDGGDVARVANRVVGTERMKIDLTGVAAHTSRAGQGISCAVIFAEALAEIQREGWFGEVRRDGGWAASNLGVVRGGSGTNVTMPELHALAECRSFDLDLRARVLGAWRAAFEGAVERANAAAARRGVEGRAAVAFSPGPEYKPYALAEDHPAVVTARRAVERTGRTAVLFDHTGGMDTCRLVSRGIPAVGLGMGDHAAHSAGEWIDVGQFLDACRVAVELALGEGD